jgi:flagellar biosynthesis/type III secretory pathway protein FliH
VAQLEPVELRPLLARVHERAATMSIDYMRKFEREAMERGLVQGRNEGRNEGQADILHRLLTRRFGALPASIAARLQTATRDQLELWADRVLTAATLDDVLA